MERAGIYIHIPFCRSRCSYCDFATGTYESTLAERYVNALTEEIAGFYLLSDTPEVDTIYFGGGTPSLLSPEQTERILCAVYKRFRVSSDAEITMEMNPGTVDLDGLRRLRHLGINRASSGLQTFNDMQLRRLGRTHTAEDARNTFANLREAGFTNISFDLIAGLPEQSIDDWSHNLDEALALRPVHLSLYLLEVHKETPLAEQIKRGMWREPDADLAAEMYQLMLERTRAAGYQQYEISNFCLPGHQSRHNMKYWTNAPFYGFGCSAHSFDGERTRWSNERDAKRYVELTEQKGSAIVDTNRSDPHTASAEALFLGLRLMERGVNLNEHQARFHVDVCEKYKDDLQRFAEAGLIEIDGDTLRLTREGALLSNEVFAAFV